MLRAAFASALFMIASGLFAADAPGSMYGLKPGPWKLESAGAMAFGPDGILFLGDSAAGAVVAIDTKDRAPRANTPEIYLPGLDQKIAATLGTRPSEVRFHDMKVNPLSKNIYLSLTRGRGNGGIPVLLRVTPEGEIAEVPGELPHASVELPGLSEEMRLPGRRLSRTLVITDVEYDAGKVLVAGLSNEDFSSTFRMVPFPFTRADEGTTVEIYHTSHFTYETSSPVRTMVPYTAGGERYLLAAYTCTPLVRLRMADLKPAARVTGNSIAELGRHSSPLDMIVYSRAGKDYLLVANTSRGVLKVDLAGVETMKPITDEDRDDLGQMQIEKVGLKGVVQLDAYTKERALMMFNTGSGLTLQTATLP